MRGLLLRVRPIRQFAAVRPVRAVRSWPGPIRVYTSFVATAFVLAVLGIMIGFGVKVVGSAVVESPEDQASAIAAAMRSGDGRELISAYGVDGEPPISSNGVDVSLQKISESADQVIFRARLSDAGRSHTARWSFVRTQDNATFLGLVRTWTPQYLGIFTSIDLDYQEAGDESTLIINGRDRGGFAPVMPGTYKVKVIGTPGMIESPEEDVSVLRDVTMDPTWSVTSAGQQAAISATNAALLACTTTYLDPCPSRTTVTRLPAGYTVTALTGSTVRIRSTSSGSYLSYGYTYSFSVDTEAEINSSGKVTFQN